MADPVEDFFTSAATDTASAHDAANDPVHAFLSSGGEHTEASDTPQPRTARPDTGTAKSTLMRGAMDALLHMGSEFAALPYAAGNSIRELTHGAPGTRAEAAASAASAAQQNSTYQPRTPLGQGMADVLDTPGRWLGAAGDWAGNKVAAATDNAGLAGAADVALQAAPTIFGLRGGRTAVAEGARSLGTVADQPRGWPQAPGQVPTGAARVEPTFGPAPGTAPGPQAAIAEPVAATAAPAASAAPAEPPPTFSEPPAVAEGGSALPPAQQAARAQTLQAIGLNPQFVRKSAITGDPKAASTDFQTSKLDGPGGNLMRTTLDNERSAVSNFADKITRGTGGSVGADQTALYARGNTILAPFDDLKAHFDDATKSLYKQADQAAAGQPVPLARVHQFVGGDTADFIGTVEGEQLLKGVKARMKSLGMVDADGNPQPVTVQQAERLRQYVGDQWSPRTSRLIGRMKDTIDEDVTSNAGADTYAQARALRALRSRILDDPKGIAKIMDASGPEGINRAVPTERIPDAITGLPVDQLTHIVKTLKAVPEELQPQAQAALNEIKAHFANRVQEIGSKTQGQWNARGVTQYLSGNTARMAQVFSPEEMKSFGTLNDAGHILKVDQSYPGAEVQKQNLLRSGAMAAAQHGLTAAGAGVAGPLGAMVGRAVGEKVAGKMEAKSSLQAVKDRHMNLSDIAKSPPP